jgi:hypothetical protein
MILNVRGGKNNALLGEIEQIENEIKNRNFLVSVCNLYIFDNEENLALSSKTLTNCKIDVGEEKGKITFTDACFSLDLLRFATFIKEKDVSDYRSLLENQKKENIKIRVTPTPRECKVLAIAEVRDNVTKKVVGHVRYGFPHCEIYPKCFQEFNCASVASHDFEISVFPDFNGDLVEIVFD